VTTQRLVAMANQVASFFASYPEPEAIESTFGHLKAYWDPRMRREIEAHLANAGGAGLTPIALAAVKRLADMDAAKKKSA
jgi:formate dehydrogenase subunit delta